LRITGNRVLAGIAAGIEELSRRKEGKPSEGINRKKKK
jgi:hypothetical protein